MSTRSLGPLVLSLCLLLASLAGLAQHEHGIAPEIVGFGCVADHSLDSRDAASNTRTELESAAPEHRHQCIACHANGKRSPLPDRVATIHSFRIAEASHRLSSPPRVERPRTSKSLRGPPSA